MSVIANLKDSKGNVILPKTLERLVYDDNGVSLDRKLNKDFSIGLNGNTLSLIIDGVIVSSVVLPVFGNSDVFGDIIVDVDSLSIEEGKSATIKIKLDKPPTNNQIVTLSVDNEYCSISPKLLTFTPNNFSTEQIVTISTVYDSVNLDTKNVTLILSSSNVSNKTVAITITNLTNKPPTPSDSLNIYNKDNFNTLGFYDPNNGNIKADPTYGGSDKFEVEGGGNIIFNGVNGCYFDLNGNYISGVEFTTIVPRQYTNPPNAKYFSFGLDKNKNIEDGYLYNMPIPTDSIDFDVNLIKLEDIEHGGYYDNKNNWVEDASFVSTGKINVVPGVKHSQTNGASVRAFNKYDRFVGIVKTSDLIPYGAEYIRMAISKNNISSAIFKLIRE